MSISESISANTRNASTHKGTITISTKKGSQSFSIQLPGEVDDVAQNTANYLAKSLTGSVDSITLDGVEVGDE